jgi:hypothetical protein
MDVHHHWLADGRSRLLCDYIQRIGPTPQAHVHYGSCGAHVEGELSADRCAARLRTLGSSLLRIEEWSRGGRGPARVMHPRFPRSSSEVLNQGDAL